MLKEKDFIRFFLPLFLAGAALRFFLFLANPPANALDDHFEPVSLIMRTGALPAKTGCWQCYHPPVFYAVSAAAGKLVLAAGLKAERLFKTLQFLPCLYGVLHLWFIYLILRLLPLARFARILAFAAACFLPQHIYISAMHSNDTLSYLSVSVCVYLLLTAIGSGMSFLWLSLLSLAMTVSVFTKYTDFIILPVVMIIFTLLFSLPGPAGFTGKRPAGRLLVALALPLCLLAAYCWSNTINYGKPLPWNTAGLEQPRAEKISFVTFKPWETAAKPFINPGSLDSFWTLLYGKMWFDIEPKFLYFTDPGNKWGDYYAWMRAEAPFPGDIRLSPFTRFSGAGLILLGLLPLSLSVFGTIRLLSGYRNLYGRTANVETIKLSVFPLLLAFNLAVIAAVTLSVPFYSSIKASYLLNSLPALTVTLGAGLTPFGNRERIKKIFIGLFSCLFALSALHILQIVRAAWAAV